MSFGNSGEGKEGCGFVWTNYHPSLPSLMREGYTKSSLVREDLGGCRFTRFIAPHPTLSSAYRFTRFATAQRFTLYPQRGEGNQITKLVIINQITRYELIKLNKLILLIKRKELSNVGCRLYAPYYILSYRIIYPMGDPETSSGGQNT